MVKGKINIDYKQRACNILREMFQDTGSDVAPQSNFGCLQKNKQTNKQINKRSFSQ